MNSARSTTFWSRTAARQRFQQLHISPIEAPTDPHLGGRRRTGLLERADHLPRNLFPQRIWPRHRRRLARALFPQLLPNLTAQQQSILEAFLQNNNAYSLDLNSLAFRAQGIETTVESGIGKNIFLRGGYTYLDSVVQHSFSSDNQALLGGYAPTFDGIPVGIYSPLKGARPFRRPPHTGFFTASYAGKKLTAVFTSAFASRSDDSTFLGYEDLQQGNSLVLPNRNLDFGFARLDLGASYQLLTWLAIYGQAENLLSQQHIAPIGYPSLPMNFRTGLRIQWGPGSRR